MSASLMPNNRELSAVLPLLIPAMAAILLPIASLDKDQATQKWIRGAMFFIAMVATIGGFFYVTGLWKTAEQPLYGPLHMDRLAQFASIFVLITAAMAILQLWDHLHQEGWVKGETLALLLMSASGMILFASTTNLLLLFVALELLSIPLYALTATLRARPETAEGAIKYFLTGAVASSFFLMGSVLLYGATGSLDVRSMIGLTADPLVLMGGALLLLGFLFKVSAVPFHQWTPDAYEAAPHPIAGFMSVATKGVALIALLRVFGAGMGSGLGNGMGASVLGPRMRMAIALLAVLTMIGGNLTALVQTNAKRMLAYSSISHAGYLLLAFVADTPQAYTGLLYYLIAYMAMNMGAFGFLTAMGLVGEHTNFEHLKGLGWKRPGLAIAATTCLLGLAGLPPTAGFFGKYILFKEVISTGHVGLAIVGVLASLASVYYYLRIPVALFLEKPTERQEQERAETPAVEAPYAGGTVMVCALLVLAAGLLQTLFVDGFAARAIRDWMELGR
jgi:NADH-quinone oxidoreductase subunit N